MPYPRDGSANGRKQSTASVSPHARTASSRYRNIFFQYDFTDIFKPLFVKEVRLPDTDNGYRTGYISQQYSRKSPQIAACQCHRYCYRQCGNRRPCVVKQSVTENELVVRTPELTDKEVGKNHNQDGTGQYVLPRPATP